jgi:hypothetical protein
MEALAGETVELKVGERVRDLRLRYADRVIDQTLVRLAPDDQARRRVFGALGEGLGHVVQFVQVALNAWLEPRMDAFNLDIADAQ